ncbi:MAG: hypothetical protein K1X51_01820 [Rhodospirillaceae bacterium]|nr:hypothetical protein [Rhodospirillaceae bacterium]
MNPLEERRKQDLAKIAKLGERSRGRIVISEIRGVPLDEAILTLTYPTAPSPKYPEDSRAATRVRITLGARYPFQEPAVEALDPLFNPNVYVSGRFCLGAKWLPTEGLDLLVMRLAKILTFDPEIVSDRSPANAEAALWYNAMRLTHPAAFPSHALEFDEDAAPKKKLTWTNAGTNAGAANDDTVPCPSCGATLRLYGGTTLRCPQCEAAFEVSQ